MSNISIGSCANMFCIVRALPFILLCCVSIISGSQEDNRICKVVEDDPQNYWVPHKDCNKFYMCQNLGRAQWKAHEFQCGPKTGWDDQIKTCNWLRHIKNKNKACNVPLLRDNHDKSPKKVNCKWSSWNSWSSCNGEKRSSTRRKSRNVMNGGNPCEGKSLKMEICSKPVNCRWSKFGEWTSCSVTCGGGTRESSRYTEQPSENGGKTCIGENTTIEACNPFECLVPVDCQWSAFDEWTSCSVSCGSGTRSSIRHILQPAQKNGNACTGYSTRTESCNTVECPEPEEMEDILEIDLNVTKVDEAPSTLPSYPETTTKITSSEDIIETGLDIEKIDIVSSTLSSYPETTTPNASSEQLKDILETDLDNEKTDDVSSMVTSYPKNKTTNNSLEGISETNQDIDTTNGSSSTLPSHPDDTIMNATSESSKDISLETIDEPQPVSQILSNITTTTTSATLKDFIENENVSTTSSSIDLSTPLDISLTTESPVVFSSEPNIVITTIVPKGLSTEEDISVVNDSPTFLPTEQDSADNTKLVTTTFPSDTTLEPGFLRVFKAFDIDPKK